MDDNKKTQYVDNKYCMQDVTTFYLGTKFTLEELVELEEAPFKFRMLVERDVIPKADREDTLETHLYYLEPKSFLVKIYDRLKGRVKVNVIAEKRSLFGKKRKEYTTQTITVKELVQIPVEEKMKMGMVIQELAVSKMALMSL